MEKLIPGVSMNGSYQEAERNKQIKQITKMNNN